MNELLSLPRMARRLGVTQIWLREQADRGLIPVLRAGNRYLFAAEAVEAALAAAARRNQEANQIVGEVRQ